jgi:hypothetical protein
LTDETLDSQAATAAILTPPHKTKSRRTAETVRPIIGIYTRFTFCPYDTPPKMLLSAWATFLQVHTKTLLTMEFVRQYVLQAFLKQSQLAVIAFINLTVARVR